MSLRGFIRNTRLRLEQALHESREAMKTLDRRSGPEITALEERILMSATPAAAAAPEAADAGQPEPSETASLTEARESVRSEPSPALTGEQLLDAVADSVLPESADTILAEDDAATEHTLELVIIDSSVSGLESLIEDLQRESASDLSRTLEFVILDSERDGIAQITQALLQYDGIDGLHIVSHGNDGQMNLGSTTLSMSNLDMYRSSINAWQHSMSADADLLFYGCNLAASDSGRELMNQIGAECDCDVAASDDLTGHESLGGDWDLEFSTGNVETEVVFSAAFQNNWDQTLTVYTVTNTLDDGSIGSLRWAITQANANAGIDTIEFNIAGAGPHTIAITSALPTIAEAVIIDGWSEPDFVGTPIIELNGTATGGGVDGLVLAAGSNGSSIRGLVINRFGYAGIAISGSDGHMILGNYIGTDVNGTADLGNGGSGINLYNADGNFIGGLNPGDGNVISGNADGIYMQNSVSNVVQGNLIGTDVSGMIDLGNSDRGVQIESGANNNVIGGTTAAARNIISGNNSDGIIISDGASPGTGTTGTLIQGNYIGVGADGTTAIGNGSYGVRVTSESDHTIGGTTAGAGNVIAHNASVGVMIEDSSAIGNSILGNVIHSNTQVGIDLGGNGVTANDANDGDSGSNNLQNFPVVTSAVLSGANLTVAGSLDTDGLSTQYRIEFFGNAGGSEDVTGYGEATVYLGATTVTTNGSGDATFSGVTLTGVTLSAGDYVTATATKIDDAGQVGIDDQLAYGSTSEFGANFAIIAGDSSPGTAIWRNSGDSTPNANDWDGTSFGTTIDSASMNEWRIVEAAEAPTRNEIIAVGVDTSGFINGQIWDGTTWTALPFNPIGFSGDNTSQNFDVAYESQSGNAVLVWDNGTGGTASVSYRVWDGTTWSAEQTITVPDAGTAQQLRLEANPTSNEMVLIVSDDSTDEWAAVWNGSSWGNTVVLDTVTAGDRTEISVAFESQSGNAMVVYDAINNYNDLTYQTWNGTVWSGPQTLTLPFSGGIETDAKVSTIAADRTSDRIAVGVVSGGTQNQVLFAVWDGTAWGNKLLATTTSYSGNSLVAAVGFESQSGELLVTYSEAATTPRYRTWSSGGGWSGELNVPDIGGFATVMTMASDPLTDAQMLAVQDSNSDLHYILWDGSAWGADNVVSTNTGETNSLRPFTFVFDAVDPAMNTPPVITLPAGPVNYTENDPATVIDATATATDSESTDFDAGTLTVDFLTNGTSNDRLAIRNEGAGAGQIGILGAVVTYEGTAIGTFTGGTDGATPLVVTFNAGATPVAAQALLRNITFQNVSDNPSTSARTVRFVLTDGDGGTSTAVTETVNVTTVADAPIAVDDHHGLTFDGIDDYVNLGSSASLVVTNALTMEAWVRPTAYPVSSSIILNKEGEYEVGIDSAGQLRWAFTNTDPGWDWHDTGYTLALNQWAHVSVTYDNGVVNTYVNGTHVETYYDPGSIGDTYTGMNDLRVGGRTNSPADQYFSGEIDEVRVWNVTRTEAEIRNNLDQSLAGNEAGLIGYWRFDEGTGATTADVTINGNTGTLVDGGAGTVGPQWTGHSTDQNTEINISAANGLISNDVDGEGDSLTVAELNGSSGAIGNWTAIGSTALVRLNSDGSFDYDPNGVFDSLAAGQTTTDTFTYTINDGNGGTDTATATINITGLNDAPVLDPNGTMTLTTITEDDINNSGDLVSAIIASATGDRITDADAGALEGIAISGLTSGTGTWEYDTGSGWTPVGTVSISASLLLRATDSLRFVPDGVNGDTAFVTFVAWDQTSGTAGTKVDTSTFGGTTAFSAVLETAAITITNVNDAPAGIPTITGTSTEDQILTADTSGISDPDGLGAFSYQWLRDGSAIGGATNGTYTLGDADVGTQISVEVTYTDGNGTAEGPLTSAQTAAVTNINDVPVGIPTITGTATEDQILTADTSAISDADGLGAFSYQWLRNGSAIGGATNSTYTLGDADVGTQISVEVTYTDGNGTAEGPLTSAQTALVANINDVPVGIPTITGTATEDQILTADTSGISDADGLGAFSYQWLRDGSAIGGATNGTYTLGDADVGTQISVEVTYSDGNGTAEGPLTSAQTAAVTNVNDVPVGIPTITGTATEDQILTADTSGISDNDGLGAFSYQWLRDGSAIGGATNGTYTLGDADVGTQISVEVTYSDGNGTAEGPLTSAQTAAVTNVNDVPVGIPTITGTVTEDQILTADTSAISDNDGLGAFSYQWLRDGSAIGGATNGTYTLGDADVGTQISVEVSYTDGNGTAEGPLTSAQTAAVTNINDAPVGIPTITGTATEDQILTADTSGISDNDGLGAFSYQWLRNGSAIDGATSGTYTLGDADVGTQISVEVTYTDGHGTAEGPLASAQTALVANVNDAPAGIPIITGTTTEDQILTADTSGISDNDGLGALSYQWLRDGVAIGGATGTTYTLGDADVNTRMSVQVTYTDGNGTAEGPLTSAQTALIANVNDTPAGLPTITGTVTEDQVLTADTSGITDEDGLGAFTYQWLRNGVAIGGATSGTYMLGDADVGTQISVEVSYTDGNGTAEGPLTSVQTAAVTNVNDSPVGIPTITGTVTEDQGLTADTSGISDNDGLGAFSYQWLRDGVAVGGATGSTYTLGDVDVNTRMSVQVTYTDGNGTAEGPLTSAQTALVANVNDIPVGVPTITGTVTEDQTLTADTSGISDNDGLGAFSHQWLRDGVAIGGATGNTYTLGDADVDTQISVEVTYTDGNGTAEGPLTSAQTAFVSNVNDAPVGIPAITGTVTEDQVLTADTSGISDADGLGAFSYQWLRDGVTIGGATGSTYTLGDADVGTRISVEVSYTDGNGTAEGPLTSAQTALVANINDTPAGLPTITGTVTEDQTLTADTSSISDNDGLGAFSYQWLRDGAAIGGATGSTYTLGDADVGTRISVEVTYTDGHGTAEGPLTSAQTAAVTNVNDAPVDLNLTGGTVAENSSTGTPVGTITATDPDSGDTTIYSLVNTAGGRFQIDSGTGVITVNNGGLLNFESSASHAIRVRVTDSGGLVYEENFTITVTDVNDRPVAGNDMADTMQAQSLTDDGTLLFSNDGDEDGDLLTVVLQSGTVNGTLVLNPDGSFIYTPNTGFFGTDSFEYLVNDGLLDSNIATVTIDVESVGDTGDDDPGDDDPADDAPGSDDPGDDDPADDDPADDDPADDDPADDDSDDRESDDVVISDDELQGLPVVRQVEESASNFEQSNARDFSIKIRISQNMASRVRAESEYLFERIRQNGPVFTDLFTGGIPAEIQEDEQNPFAGFEISDNLVVGSTVAVSTSLTVGYVLWILRGGSLLTTFISSIPAWQAFDPLPILQNFEADSDDDSDDSLESIVSGS